MHGKNAIGVNLCAAAYKKYHRLAKFYTAMQAHGMIFTPALNIQ